MDTLTQETAGLPTTPAKPKKPEIRTSSNALHVTLPNGAVWSYMPVEPALVSQFLMAGLRYLAVETLRKNPSDPQAELAARFAKVTATAWGDERPARRQKAAPVDPVEELVEIIHAAKLAATPPIEPDDTRTRLMLVGEPPRGAADLAAFLRKVRKVPHVAEEIARRKAVKDGSAATSAVDPLAAL